MKLITRQILANSLADRFRLWEREHPEYSEGQRQRGIRSLAEQLEELGPWPDPDACDAVIGEYMYGKGKNAGATWTAVPSCDECKKSVSVVVEIGEKPDYESATATICIGCLQAAVKLADATDCAIGSEEGRPDRI